jgi:3-deoxy-manno-octulosonate cytidylyltransferase (CMP-KDO synthetase)
VPPVTPGTASPDSLRVLVVIPARYGSTRLPGKALADLAGAPMIVHVWRRAAAARGVEAVVVATDDARIVDAVTRAGGAAVLTDPAHACGTDRVAEVAAARTCDVVVNVQGDEPLLEPALIGALVAPLARDPALPMSTLRRPLTDPAEYASPHVVKVVIDRSGDALYFSRAPIPGRPGLRPSDGVPAGAWAHVGLYAYRRDALLRLAALPRTPLEAIESLEQLRALEYGFRIRTVETRHDLAGVDTPEDLERVRRRLQPIAGAGSGEMVSAAASMLEGA